MAALVLTTSIVQSVRRLTAHAPFPAFVPGDRVQFQLSAGLVRAQVSGIDAHARKDLPLGVPYRLSVIEAPAQSGYRVGMDCTIRAACLERDDVASASVLGATVGIVPLSSATRPMFLVAFLREGGNYPIQGALLVQGASLDEANAAAMQSLTAELEADVRERGELPEAMVMLLNASEVPTPAVDVAVVASVSW